MTFAELELNSFFEIPGDDGFPTFRKLTHNTVFDMDRSKEYEFPYEPDQEVCRLPIMIYDENDVRGYHLDFEDVTRRRKYFVFHTGVKL